MIKTDMTFKDVCDFLKKDEPKFIDSLDHLLGLAQICFTAVVGPEALPILNLLSAKGELIKIGKILFERLTSKKDNDEMARYNRMGMAYCLICYTSFFEALDKILPKIRETLFQDLSEQLPSATIYLNPSNDINTGDNEKNQPESKMFSIRFPHPINDGQRHKEQVHTLHEELSEGFLTFLDKTGLWNKVDSKSNSEMLDMKRQLSETAMEYFSAQYFKLAEQYEEFFVWTNIQEHGQLHNIVENQSVYLKNLLALSSETSESIDRGFIKLEETIKSIPERIQTTKISNCIKALTLSYKANSERPIIEDEYTSETGKPALKFPKKTEIFVPQYFRAIHYAKKMTLENEGVWQHSKIKHQLGPFILSYLSSPYSVQTPLLVLGHPGSGKSLLTEILAARLSSPSYTPIRVVLRNINAEKEIHSQIEEQISKDIHEDVDWASFSRSFVSQPPLIIFDGFDELIQTTSQIFSNYLTRLKDFQIREAELGRPVRVIVTSRMTLIDKVYVPINSTVIRLENFDERQCATWIDIWNAKNRDYFIQNRLSQFTLPNMNKIVEMAQQPLLLLMLALYDSDNNQLRKIKQLNQTVLYDKLLRLFIVRERDKKKQGLNGNELESLINKDLQRLGVAALGMFNRRVLHIQRYQLNEDLAFLGLTREMKELPSLTISQADLVLGKFFFICESKATLKGEASAEEESSSYEFLHNTFGEFLLADFILRRIQEVTDILLALQKSETLQLKLHEMLESKDGIPGNWFASLIFTPLHYKPGCLEMLREWFIQKAIGQEDERDFFKAFDQIIYNQIKRILYKKDFSSIVTGAIKSPFPELPLRGHLAIYSLNLIILRTIMCREGFIFDEGLLVGYEDNTQPWEQLTYLWRSWFSHENLNGLTAIMTAKREGATIILKPKETFGVSHMSNSIGLKVKVSEALGDNISPGLSGLLAYASLGISVDINRQKELETQLYQSQKMESIGVLAGGIAHDFNNILTAILGHAEIIRRYSVLNVKATNSLGVIEDASRRAGRMISKLLGFARKSKYKMELINLNDIVYDSIKLLEQVVDKYISLSVELDNSLPIIQGDANQLEQVIMNFIVNARDAMPKGGRIVIKTSAKTVVKGMLDVPLYVEPGDYVLLSVSDTGMGIPEEIINKIFEPFFTTKDRGKGTGLGLSMVYGAVKDHRGYIEVQSKVGIGSVFEVYLPVTPATTPTATQVVVSRSKGKETVLVVDDEEAVLDIMREALESSGYKVFATSEPNVALDIYRRISSEIVLVITDIAMPQMDGKELIRHIKQINQAVKVLAVSGYSKYIEGNEEIKDIEGILQKPFEAYDLLNVVRHVLDEKPKTDGTHGMK